MDSTDDIRDALAALIDRMDPALGAVLECGDDPDAALRLVAITAAVGAELDDSLRGAVAAARTAGASWERIGQTLSVSRQAAQQRFGHRAPGDDPEVWHMSPVTSVDEMYRLNEAGRYGWHSVGYGMLYHDLVRTDRAWEHRRVGILTSRQPLEDAGWQKIGGMWFPWAYYARPTGARARCGEPPERRRV